MAGRAVSDGGVLLLQSGALICEGPGPLHNPLASLPLCPPIYLILISLKGPLLPRTITHTPPHTHTRTPTLCCVPGSLSCLTFHLYMNIFSFSKRDLCKLNHCFLALWLNELIDFLLLPQPVPLALVPSTGPWLLLFHIPLQTLLCAGGAQ